MNLYGILDDFGDVIRWQRDRPSDAYRYIIKRVKKLSAWEKVADVEPALL